MLNQTLEPLEVVVVDDGSTDGSASIVKRIAAYCNKVRLLSVPRVGLPTALNHAIESSNGNWIARMDADDVALPDRFQAQFDFARDHKLDIVGCNMQAFGSSKGLMRYPETHDGCQIKQLIASPLAHPAAMVRKNVFEVLMYSNQFPKAQDYDLWERAFRYGFKFGNIQKSLVRYRVHESQATQNDKDIRLDLARDIRRRSMEHFAPKLKKWEAKDVVDFLFYDKEANGEIATSIRLLINQVDKENFNILEPYIYSALLRRPGNFGNVVSMWLACAPKIKNYAALVKGLPLIGLSILGNSTRKEVLKSYGRVKSNIRRLILNVF